MGTYILPISTSRISDVGIRLLHIFIKRVIFFFLGLKQLEASTFPSVF